MDQWIHSDLPRLIPIILGSGLLGVAGLIAKKSWNLFDAHYRRDLHTANQTIRDMEARGARKDAEVADFIIEVNTLRERMEYWRAEAMMNQPTSHSKSSYPPNKT